MIWFLHTNDLGLTGLDVVLGGRPDVKALRANTKVAAEAFLNQRKADLIGEAGKKHELALDYSKSSEIRALGYRSSFYYHCWDIYLPYSLRTNSGAIATVIVQLTDSVPGHRHDPQKFRVIRAMSLDGQGKVIKWIENHEKGN
jgi:hypothetical protein